MQLAPLRWISMANGLRLTRESDVELPHAHHSRADDVGYMSVRFATLKYGRCSYEHHSAATHRPLFITGAWGPLAVDTQEDFEVARSRCLWTFSRRAPSRVHLSPGRGCTWYVHVPMSPTLLRRTAVVDDRQGARCILMVPASSSISSSIRSSSMRT